MRRQAARVWRKQYGLIAGEGIRALFMLHSRNSVGDGSLVGVSRRGSRPLDVGQIATKVYSEGVGASSPRSQIRNRRREHETGSSTGEAIAPGAKWAQSYVPMNTCSMATGGGT